ncbi:MAG: glutathione S-transferase family protein [Pseudomonadales bacterium]|nr:glutathione S-transferase family protein [Pseudomonadales bacterium]
MLTLYHCLDARSFRPLWTLEEMQLPYRLEMLPFPPRALAREFKTINPLGTVPALLDGELMMTESAAICQYLVSRYQATALAVEPEQADYGEFLNWLHFGEATLTFPQTLLLRYGRFEPPERRQTQVVEDYTGWFLGRLRALERPLASQEMLCPSGFSIADISVGYALLLAEALGLDKDFTPAVAAYWQRLQARPGYQRAQARQQEQALALGLKSPIR